MKLITTEDVLKAKSVSLGRTTMEKLAAFRFQATAQCSSDVEVYGTADSMEKAFEEPEKAHGLRHDATSHEVENPYHVFNSSGHTSHNEEDLYPIFDEHDPVIHNEEELYYECDDPEPTGPNEEFPDQVIDEATVPDHDDDIVMLGDEEISISPKGAPPIVQPDSEDEFPLDNDLETEMAQLSMPDKTYESLSRRLDLQSLRNEDLQGGDTDSGHFQPSSPTSCIFVRDTDVTINVRSNNVSSAGSVLHLGTVRGPLKEDIDCPSVQEEEHDRASTGAFYQGGAISPPEIPAQTMSLVESDEYSPLKPFARPGFPSKVLDRSPITGISSNTILRTCFRIGEALREGALCEGLGQGAVIELFARVMDSSQDIIPSKLYFGFADLFHDRPPFMRGTLENNKISSLQETESRMLLGVDGPAPMVRCLGRLKRIVAGPPGWMLYIINIRPTDWEEVRWTRQIAGAGMTK